MNWIRLKPEFMKSQKKIKLLLNIGAGLLLLSMSVNVKAQQAFIREELIEFKTYPFSDPDPIPEINRIYPYFYFHGYTNNAIQQKWKMVVLENDYIKVYVCPEIGGKIWGAIEKSTGKEFLYYNHVVKFRDVAMRGAWTSGGLEYNFGDIGHIPTCATPVDYAIRENTDGSVSCVVGAIDLPSGTKWNVEIKVSPGKAFFETKAGWFNNTELPCTYYHWMNAAAKAGNDLEFIYPGKNWIGHGTETGDWPMDDDREISWYKNNDFGSYKSYHVINSYSDFFGGYWHDEDFGFGHYCNFDEKLGKKLWIWGLAQEGMIWENLLTDNDGQYIEFQAGKLFNQAADSSTETPFKHKEFPPHDVDIMNEIWFPLKETKGMAAASEYAVLNLVKDEKKQMVLISALQSIDDTLFIYRNGNLIYDNRIKLQPLKLHKTAIEVSENDEIEIILGNHKLKYSSRKDDVLVDRPPRPDKKFDWETAYGHYIKGLELEKQREFIRARTAYEKALEKDSHFLPALTRMALSFYRQMKYEKAMEYIRQALAIDTYDGEANYMLGLISRETGNITLSKSGFSIAMGQVAYRTAAATELAVLFLKEKDWEKAIQYAEKALSYNVFNIEALQILSLAKRKQGKKNDAAEVLKKIAKLDATNHFQKMESFLLSGKKSDKEEFIAGITNELPHESYLNLALNYYKKGCVEEAVTVLQMAPENPIINLWLAHMDQEDQNQHMKKALSQSPEFVFPHRIETAEILSRFIKDKPDWRLNYYLGLILWHKGLIQEAKMQFEACGTEPDFAAFYLAKMKLEDERVQRFECVEKARKLEPDNWRVALAMAEYYLAEGSGVKAMKILRPFFKTNPEQPAIGLLYVRCLNALHEHEKALRFLESYELLPFEGATIGRDLYNEACLLSAFTALKKGKNDEAINLAEKAKNWPVNLGVGKPFNVDERLEDYILFLAFNANGKVKEAKQIASEIMEYTPGIFKEENSRLYLQLIVLQQNGNKQQADHLLENFLEKYPESKYMKWVEAKYIKSQKASEIEQDILREKNISMAYDTKFTDKGFQLLLDFLKEFDE